MTQDSLRLHERHPVPRHPRRRGRPKRVDVELATLAVYPRHAGSGEDAVDLAGAPACIPGPADQQGPMVVAANAGPLLMGSTGTARALSLTFRWCYGSSLWTSAWELISRFHRVDPAGNRRVGRWQPALCHVAAVAFAAGLLAALRFLAPFFFVAFCRAAGFRVDPPFGKYRVPPRSPVVRSFPASSRSNAGRRTSFVSFLIALAISPSRCPGFFLT